MSSSDAVTLKMLAVLAVQAATAQLEAFSARLANALLSSSDKMLPSEEANMALQSFQQLDRARGTFHQMASSALAKALHQEVGSVVAKSQLTTDAPVTDLSLVSFEAMEIKVLVDTVSQAIEAKHAVLLDALGIRLARLLRIEEVPASRNPFRPAVFIHAIVDAWNNFDLENKSARMLLQQLLPDVFLQMEPIWCALNDALIAHGIFPDIADAYRVRKAGRSSRLDPAQQNKLQQWLGSAVSTPNARPAGDNAATMNADLSSFLLDLQTAVISGGNDAEARAYGMGILDRIKKDAPAGVLSATDMRVIDLLSSVFKHVFAQQDIAVRVKALLGRLQIPVLKAALLDHQFFFDGAHPARRLMDAVAYSGMLLDQQRKEDDRLFIMVEQLVERVQQDYEQQIELFSRTAVELAALLEQETDPTSNAMPQAIEEAKRQGKIAECRKKAERDIASRIETGEVAGFVENFLESQWSRILALAYSVQEKRPEAIKNALATMDNLIWSAKPKTSPVERKELISKLPLMLSLLNAWLNAVKWEGEERVTFFSMLAERHAALVRVPVELTRRHRLETTMTILQKASEYQLTRRWSEQQKVTDQFTQSVDMLGIGHWIERHSVEGRKEKWKLAWISPNRSRFIFLGRHGQEPVTWTAEQLAGMLRARQAVIIPHADSMVDQALSAALEQIDWA